MNQERLGISLVGIGSLILVLTGLLYIRWIQLSIPLNPGLLNGLLGVIVLSIGAYLLTRENSAT